MKKVLKIAKDFSEYPKLRYCNLSETSAEKFYHEMLNKAFAEAFSHNQTLVVDLDDTAGYTSSFLDEAFGNLVYDFSLEVVKSNIEIISKDEPYWIPMIENETFPQWEERRDVGKFPKITKSHNPWYRIEGNELIKKEWLQNELGSNN